ncbi:oxidoreductase [Streptomyces sp. NPDC087850]|uniref:DUF7847 domain-containing protein n=1 Tax=Streptomyces sp. NPDC087850 TaxID=3365809 RepID=UPI00382DB4D0
MTQETGQGRDGTDQTGPNGTYGPPGPGDATGQTGPNGPYVWGALPGGGWGWVPPPPKPGVIPLGPLRTGEIFTGAFAVIGRYWKPLFGVTLVAYGAAALVVAATMGIAYAVLGDRIQSFTSMLSAEDLSLPVLRPVLIAFLCVWGVGILALVIAQAVVQAACPAVIQEAVLGRPTTFGAVIGRVGTGFLPVLCTTLLTTAIAFAPFVVLTVATVGITLSVLTLDSSPDGSVLWLVLAGALAMLALAPLSIWLWTRYSLAPAAAVIESHGPVMALRRSAQLVRGSWWRVFGMSALALLLAGVTGMLIEQVINVLAVTAGQTAALDPVGDLTPGDLVTFLSGFAILALLAGLISQILTATLPQLVLGLLYVDQRIRKENLAPTLIEAAGPSHPTNAPPAP